MRRHLAFAAGAALLAASAGQAGAQEGSWRPSSRFDLGIYAGGALTSSWYETRTVVVGGGNVTENDDEEGQKPGYSPAFGAMATWWVMPKVGLRLHGAYVPMRVPSSFGAFENAGDRKFYALNTYLYDLDLVLRPWAGNGDVSRWLSSVYLFAGGGGLTVDVAGDGPGAGPGGGCEPGTLANAACLPYEREAATVGQGSFGAGIDLIPLTRSLAVFGELGGHVYDSPVHVGDSWVGPVTVPTGSTVRVADDRTALTGRLALGLKLMFGMAEPPMVAVTPPPMPPEVPMAPTPPADDVRSIRVCVVEGGMLREVEAMYDATRGDTTAMGRPFGQAYPSMTGYAAGAPWYINNDAMDFGGSRYVKFGLPRVVGVTEVARLGEFQGVSVFAEPGATGTPDVVYVPVRPGCEVQAYQREQKVRTVRG